MTILVTGAGGFLGRHVVSALLSAGHDVRALILPKEDVSALKWTKSVDVFRADLCTSSELERAFTEVQATVHLAALLVGTPSQQYSAAVVGTERLLSAMEQSTCRRLVLASSFSVYDINKTRPCLDETAPLHDIVDIPKCDGYTIAKWWQERVARNIVEKNNWNLTVLRPGLLWGRDHAYLSQLGLTVGKLQVVIGPRTLLPLTHVENCAEFFARVVFDARSFGQTYNVVDSPGVPVWKYLSDYMRGTREHRIRVPIPSSMTYAAIRLAHSTVLKRVQKLPGLLIPQRFEARLRPLTFTNAKAKQQLGWTPPLDYESCLRRTY